MTVKAAGQSLILGLALAMATSAGAQTSPDTLRLVAEAQAFARESGDAVWPGFGDAPFGILIVEADRELLACRAPAPSGFTPLGTDPATGCETFIRGRSGLSDALLAAMPIFGPPSTIVVGSPASTGRSPAGWTRTLLHEHFHQWQAALPGYYARVDALDLKGGDESGMWMLNFPFPYDDADVVVAHRAAALALVETITARGRPEFTSRLSTYLEKRAAFAAAAGEREWRYAELQLWQEGVARWTEIELGLRYPDPAVQAAARSLQQQTLGELALPDLKSAQRTFAYPFGAGEAMVLEACNPDWREGYRDTLALGALLQVCAT